MPLCPPLLRLVGPEQPIAQQRFVFPAIASAVFNLGVIVMASAAGEPYQVALFAGAGALGALVYIVGLAVLRVEELATLANMARARLGTLR